MPLAFNRAASLLIPRSALWPPRPAASEGEEMIETDSDNSGRHHVVDGTLLGQRHQGAVVEAARMTDDDGGIAL